MKARRAVEVGASWPFLHELRERHNWTVVEVYKHVGANNDDHLERALMRVLGK